MAVGGIDPFTGEPFEITLEEELFHDYDLHTLLKPNVDNYNEYSQRYNLICKALHDAGDDDAVQNLINLRYEARRQALNDIPLELNISPYSDEGAAICYGYVEGSREKVGDELIRPARAIGDGD